MSTETPKLEAKPCPFCGSPAGKANHRVLPKQMPDGTLYERRSVQCSRIFKGCMCEGPIKGSEAEAIAAWNARATDAELSRVTEERDKETWRVGQAEQELAKVRAERDAALRRVEELEKAVHEAIPFARDYALHNPKHWVPWSKVDQDPNGVHAWLSENDKPASLDAAEKGGASSRDIKPPNAPRSATEAES